MHRRRTSRARPLDRGQLFGHRQMGRGWPRQVFAIFPGDGSRLAPHQSRASTNRKIHFAAVFGTNIGYAGEMLSDESPHQRQVVDDHQAARPNSSNAVAIEDVSVIVSTSVTWRDKLGDCSLRSRKWDGSAPFRACSLRSPALPITFVARRRRRMISNGQTIARWHDVVNRRDLKT